ncbi:MAG: HPF/RaiA family ribosome-associated protein [Phycisphaerae bacterium]|nr:HPF/RaiA family ribosome-associated protein [Phycisphaerae bacterium]
MQLRITGMSGNVPAATREFVKRRVAFAIARFENRIARVSVRLDDSSGPRMGLDKRCRIRAWLQPSGQIVAEVFDSKVDSAVARAADRLERGLRRELEHRHRD